MEGITDIPKNFKEGLDNLKTSITEGLSDLKNGILNLPQNIANGMKNILTDIFVPSEDYLEEKVSHIREKFTFAESVIGTAEAFKQMFSIEATEPPKIVIDMSDVESDYNYGEEVYALDMTWYARYKPTVDTILSSIIWVFFAWRLFMKLPSIISGSTDDE